MARKKYYYQTKQGMNNREEAARLWHNMDNETKLYYIKLFFPVTEETPGLGSRGTSLAELIYSLKVFLDNHEATD